jgi:molybdopterin molybdotransferase
MTLSAILDIITRHIDPMPEERVPVIDALGRVVSRPLSARRDLPPFDVSSLDGYAVKGQGTRFLLKGSLEPLGPIPSGLKEGEALFVPTGGRFPPGKRFVAREHAAEKAQVVTVKDGTGKRKTVRKGDWVRKGQPLACRGEVVGPASMGRLAQGGHETIRVFGRPQVAVVATGDELKKGTITDSNKFLLAGLIRRDGGEAAGLYTTGDDEEEIAQAVSGASMARLVILTGGTALGKRDVTKQAVRRLGFRFLLDSAPILPGKTMAFGKKGKTRLFILPGRPTAVQTLYGVFVRPALLAMAGRPPDRTEYLLPLPGRVEKPAGAIMLIPVSIEDRPAAIGAMYADEPNGFVVLEEGTERVAAGQRVRVLRI